MIGGPKLWPRVSAGKTWSGTITGVVSGALLGLAVAHFGAPGVVKGAPIFFASFAASALAQVGDLAESSVKRRFGVKDSSRLIPGHGGVMDRLDGFIFASVFAALLGAFRGLSSAAAGVFFW
jgi:phosphatidate cytidylyltransferase